MRASRRSSRPRRYPRCHWPCSRRPNRSGFRRAHFPPEVNSSDIDNAYTGAENDLVTLAPTTPHIFATGSEHYIQLSQPDLVINATLLVLARVTTHGE